MKKMKKSLLIALLALVAALCFAVAACGGGGITFKFVTGEGAPVVEDAQPEAGSEYTLPTPPEWEGHSFEGWYLNPEFSGNPVTSQKAEEDTTFYAKWETMYLVTLELDGGTLAKNSFYLKAGASLSEALQSYVPTKAGFEFGEWLNGTTALAANAKMPQENITLKAHYKVGYTIELYLQDRENESTYTKAATDYTGYAYADGAAFTPDYAPEGYVAVTHDGEVTTKTLDGNNAANNVFRRYYNLREFTVRFLANSPTSDREASENGKYGDTIELPTEEFTRDGYLLIGWSENRDGSDMIPVTHKLQNVAEFTPAEYEIKKEVALFAVWQKGSEDIFGGHDYIYLMEDGVYLQRAGYLFAGEKRGNDNLYLFNVPEVSGGVLQCRVFENGTFCYKNDAARSERSFSRFDTATSELNTNETILFNNGFNELKYTKVDENERSISYDGTFGMDKDGYYRTHFETASSGALIEDFTFLTSIVEDESGNDYNVFVIRNEEDCELGEMLLYSATPSGMTPNTYGVTLELDGFGYATFTYQGEEELYYYYFEEEAFEGVRMLVLYYVDETTGEEQMAGTFVVDTFNGQNGFIYFDYESYGTYEEEDDGGGVLVLDGVSGGTFTKDGKSQSGYYYTSETLDGDTIAYLYNGTTFIGAFNIAVTRDVDDEGNYIYEYSYVQYGDYAEYYLATDDGFDDNLLMIAGVTGDDFTLYLSVTAGQYYYIVATGTLSSKGSVYTATVTEHATQEDLEGLVTLDIDGLDFTKLKSFEFTALLYEDEKENEYVLMSWSSFTLEGEGDEDDVHELGTVYKEKGEGTGTLTVYSGIAVYTDKAGEGAKTYRGAYLDEKGLFSILSVDSKTIFYFRLSTDGGNTYQLLDIKNLEIIYMIDEEGSPDPYTFLFRDGLGGTFYCTEDKTTHEITMKAGTYTDTGLQSAAVPLHIYGFNFTDGGEAFRFIRIETSSGSFFIKELEQTAKTYVTEDRDELTLDGFSYAKYEIAASGVTIYGVYAPADSVGENTILFTGMDDYEDFYCYIDLVTKTDPKEDTFIVRGQEYGDYLILDNNQFREQYLSLDGKGNFTVYVAEESAEGSDANAAPTIKTIAEGTYKILDDGTCELTYTGSEPEEEETSRTVKVTGWLSYIEVEGEEKIEYYNAFYVLHEEAIDFYLNPEDWSVIALDGYGNALHYDTYGLAELGTYNLIEFDSEKGIGLLYYVNTSSTAASLYQFDSKKHEISPCEFSDTGFYTETFDSLLFMSYGAVVEAGEWLCFYNVDAEGNVTFYYDSTDGSIENPTPSEINEYGYVKKSAGFKLTDKQITFNEQTYYRNDGISITFKRATADAANYPIPVEGVDEGTSIKDLIFAPSASGKTVRGQVQLSMSGVDQWIPCLVIPKGSSNFTARLAMSDGSYFDFAINITYKGDASSYTVTGMSNVIEMMSATYLEAYAFYYEYLGMALPDMWGTLSLVKSYDNKGVESKEWTLSSEFGEASGFLDAAGKLFQIPANTVCTLITEEATEGTQAFSYYEATFTLEDEYKYCLDFQLSTDQNFGYYTYYVIMLTRMQTFEAKDVEGLDNYNLYIERVVTSDSYDQLPAGTIWDVRLMNPENGETAPGCDFAYMSDDTTIVFEFANGTDGDTTYKHYIVKLTECTIENKDAVPAYESASVEVKNVTFYSTAENKEQIAVYVNGGDITFAYINFDPTDAKHGGVYVVTKTEKAEDGSYTVTLDDGSKYKVTITNGNTVTLEAIAAEPEVTPEVG